MYKNRKFNKNSRTKSTDSNGNSKALNTIDENATIKIPRLSDIGGKNNNNFAEIEVLSSEENIPASQEPTQRYLSQRSTFTATLGRTQSRINSTQRPPNTYFELTLMKAGVQLDEADNFVLACDSIVFVVKLLALLENKNKQATKDNVDLFTGGLRDAWPKYAIKLLSGCTISIPGEDSIYQSQDSMIANFFMLDLLQEPVLDLLFEKIDKITGNRLASPVVTQNSVNMLPLILAQLKCIAHSHSDKIFERMKSIFENASDRTKFDIIASAELIFDSSKHDLFVQLLLDNMASSKDLFQNVCINTLISLKLSTRIQSQLRAKVLAYIKDDQCPDAIIPLLIKFLLKVVEHNNEDSLKELVMSLRAILNWEETSTFAKDKQLQIQLFSYIEQELAMSKKFYSIWQKTLASLSYNQFQSIDFVTLMLLLHIREDNFMYIDNILRRHIKVSPVSMLQLIRNKYGPILEHHWHVLMPIINGLLSDKHKEIVDFAKASYGAFFDMSDSVQKLILKKLLELTCDKSNQNTTTFALQMLRELWQLYPKILHNWGMLLLPFLDHIHEMSLSQTRIVMELLSSIAYPPPNLDECPSLQDQIDMLVKKQIINRNAIVKKQGIIGAVQLIDCMARIEEHALAKEDLETTFNTSADLPDGRGKIAANYITRILSSTMHSPEFLALFFDELAMVCSAGGDRANGLHLDKPFVIWLCELMTYNFQDSFIAEEQPDEIDGIKLADLKCINSLDNTNSEGPQSELPQISVNIAQLVLNPSNNEAMTSILVLAPLFNLVRVLQMQRCEGSLETINALLGCAIVLPTFFDDDNVDAIFYDYDDDKQKKILDIYFHCVNWIRETVSSFTSQREDMIRKKVLQRLADLINIENKIREMLLKAPKNYTPPQCQFIVTANSIAAGSGLSSTGKVASGNETKSKAASKKSKTADKSINQTELNDTSAVNNTTVTAKITGAHKAKASVKSNFENLYGPKELYRQMDCNIILVLNEKLILKAPVPEDMLGEAMGLFEYRFILVDIVGKLESVVGIQKFQSELPLQYIAKPEFFMCDLSNFLNIIGDNMKKISLAINAKLEEVQLAYGHADLFSEEINLLKVCMGLSLRLLVAYFSWPEWFAHEKRINKLKESLLTLVDKSKLAALKNKGIASLAPEVFSNLISYEKSIVDLKSAVYLYQLLGKLNFLSDKNSKEKQQHDIRTLCRTLLCRKWYNYNGCMERGAKCNIYLDELVKGFLRDTDFTRLKHILRIVKDESKHLNGKDAILKSFPNFNKANFPLFYRDLCETLITSLNNKLVSKALDSCDQLEFWELSSNLLNMLLEILQGIDIPRNFQIFLKYSHLYLKLVLQHGLPVFEKYLRQNPERVCELMKTMQTTTRFLHHLCCHSKAMLNASIVNLIPFLRETVENYVIGVKAILTANQCNSVFAMGNLRNKDLAGDDLIYASSSLSRATSNADSDEEIPDDDVSVDETLLNYNVSSDNSNNVVNTMNRRSKSSTSRSKCY